MACVFYDLMGGFSGGFRTSSFSEGFVSSDDRVVLISLQSRQGR